MVALMAISLSSTFVSCSDNDDDEPNFAKEIAGAYKGYSVGACNMFSDYLLGDESTATITANEDGTINLVYKSGSGDFTLNNLKLSSNKSFSGSGEVAMSMGGSTGGSYDYTLEGSVDGSKVLSLKANVDIPVPMGKMEIDFIQGRNSCWLLYKKILINTKLIYLFQSLTGGEIPLNLLRIAKLSSKPNRQYSRCYH